MNNLDQIASKIITEQELIIGPLAWIEAGKVAGIHVVDNKKGEVTVDSADSKAIIDKLVGQYERLFGKASQEVCREAAAPYLIGLSMTEIPVSLR
ncbi:MAG: hypothetical protein M3Q24_02085 [bacterium]|nr:hypothetical protein [bacterium]